jgi:LPXTG-motif cell wall-anchored protein
MDAEGENGIELEESGAAALDTAPAVEDATTLDTPDLPDIPDTVDPDQPAANPVDSSDTAVPSVVSSAAEPQTTTVTDAQPVETVGIVSAVDDDTLTVISGDVDGKVAEVTLSSAEVLGVVSVAAAQYADTYGGQLPTISASRPNRTPTMTAGKTTYLDYFVETPEGTNKGGITGITVKKGSQILEPGTSSIELMDGDKLSLNYTFNIPENALKDHLTPKTLTYKLPDGIELTENKDFKLINQSDGNQEVGTGVVDTDGVVHLTFYNDFDTSKPFTGHFDFEAKVSTVGFEESSKIRFPTGLDLLVKLPRDLAIEKKGATPVVDSDGTYIEYTVIVSSKDGWSDPIEILDELQNNDTIAGEYVTDSFKLVKIDKDNHETEIENYQNHVTDNSFHIENLVKLNSGESYRLTYRVKIIKNTAAGAGSVEFKNKARSNKKDDWKWWTTSFEDRIWKNGSYDPDTNTITWTVGVKNPYGQNLKGSKVVDTITTEGALINGSIKLEQVRDKDGKWFTKSIGEPFEPNADKKGFTYTFNQDVYGMEYKFTYVTSVPASTDGKQVTVHNDSTITIDDKDYTAGKDVTPSDRSWSFNKSKAQNSLTSTDTENQYRADWQISSDVPNTWTEYTFVDQIKKPTYGEHYGIASELDQAIRDSLTFTNADNKTLSAKDAGITVEIDYYAEFFSDASQAPDHSIDATNSTDKVHTFIIRLKNNGSYKGTSPVKRMNISSYYTHVDTTAVKAGAEFYIYNNTANYYYKKNTDKTGLTKGVSTTDLGTNPLYGSRNTNYQPTATGDYKSGMEVYYELVLDVSSLKKFSPDTDGNYTVTVTDTLPNGLTFKEGSAKGFFGWSNWCQQNGHGNFTFDNSNNFEATCIGQNVTFKFKNLDDERVKYELNKAEGDRLTHLLVRYAATVTDTKWESPKTVTGTYTNKAEWDGKHADATITLNRNLEYLTKSATYEALVNKNGEETGQLAVHYSLDINPACADLLKGGDTVILTDTLAVQDKNVTAHLDMDSVKLYDYPYKDGNPALPTTSYGMVYKRTTDSSTGYDTHTMTFTLDDARGYVLKYDYVLDSNDNVTLSNVAELTGDHHANSNTQVTKLEASGSVSRSQFTLYKVDSLNPLTRLQGAEFTLSSYNGTEFAAHDGQSLHKTDVNGEIVLHLGDNEKDDSHGEHFKILPDTLYRLVETNAPAGYKIGTADPVYFIFADADSNETAAHAWENTNKPTDLEQSKVVICTGGQQKNYTVQNTRKWLTIQKFWQDKDGKAISDALTPNTDVTVKLYRYPDGGSKDSAQYVNTITLNQKNNWIYVFKDVEEGFFYYIEEASTGGKYDVTYSDSNTTGVENGGLLTLTNKEIVGYELPSTGGTGTLPYTAVGGTMMLSALAYSFIHRKRRREGRADD